MRNVSDKGRKENQNTLFMFNKSVSKIFPLRAKAVKKTELTVSFLLRQ
jgi:hypothetical protein